MSSHHRPSSGRPDESHLQGWGGQPDPMEQLVAEWLASINEPFDRNHPARLDFYLPRVNLFIECKRFHSPRIAEQLARVHNRDVIVIQGIRALEKFKGLFGRAPGEVA